MTRDEKWGKVWYEIEKIYIAARGDEGERKILNEQRNFATHPVEILFSLFQSVQPECVSKRISMDSLTEAVAALDVEEYTNDLLGGEYLHAYMIFKANEGKSNGEKIASFRIKMGLSQGQLAEKLDVTQKDISRWETGVRSPSVQNRKKLADALECSVNDLM